MRSYFLFFIATVFTFQSVFAMDIAERIHQLRTNSDIEFQSVPIRMAYESCTGQSPANKPFIEICEAVIKGPTCARVKDEDKKDCKKTNDGQDMSAWEGIKGCAEGVFNSVKQLLEFVWDILKFVWESATDSQYRGAKYDQAMQYVNSIKLYLNTEYDKAYERAESPFREVKALQSMAFSIGKLIMNIIYDVIQTEVKEFGCLNYRAQNQAVCKLIGDIFIPPAAALALIKKGPMAIKSIPALQKGFARMAEGIRLGLKPVTEVVQTERRMAEAARIMGRPVAALTTTERNAINAAHFHGAGQVGRNGGAAAVGNYTQAQITQKARILKEANIPAPVRRDLMENGIVGLTESEARTFTATVTNSPLGVFDASRMPAKIELGVDVSFPRSAGGFTNGKIVMVDPQSGKSLISFTTLDGQTGTKWVTNAELRNPITIAGGRLEVGSEIAVNIEGRVTKGKIKGFENGKPVIEFQTATGVQTKPFGYEDLLDASQANRLPLGAKVDVPRSSGGTTPGEIIMIQGDTAKVIMFDEQGRAMYKNVKLSDLNLTPPQPLKIGADVMVPRSSGAVTAGKITGIDGEFAIVQMEENGQILIKRVKLTELEGGVVAAPVVVAPTPKPLVVGSDVMVPRSSGAVTAGKITGIEGEFAIVQMEENGKVLIKKVKLSELNSGPTAGNVFANTPTARTFSSEIVSDYVARDGSRIVVDPNSPILRSAVADAVQSFEKAGVKKVNPLDSPNIDELERAANTWLEKQVRKVEDKKMSNAEYGNAREVIVGRSGGKADLGEILACEAAVCRELSIYGSVSFSEMGYTTRVVKGNVTGGGHAWIEFLDPKTGKIIGLLDNNNTRRFYRNFEEYYKEVNARVIDTTVVARPR